MTIEQRQGDFISGAVIDAREWEAMPHLGSGVDYKELWRSGSSTAGVMRLAVAGRVDEHTHREAEHHLWVQSGCVEVRGEILGPSSYAHVPPGLRHGMSNRGSEPATFFYLYLHPADASRDAIVGSPE
jgi:mannose-6-phosphate isomerase-like protein (cupin superfamily)